MGRIHKPAGAVGDGLKEVGGETTPVNAETGTLEIREPGMVLDLIGAMTADATQITLADRERQ
jgi:hypothetical protein